MKKEKKIIIIIPLYSSYAIFLKDLVEKLITEDWKVVLITNLPENFLSENKLITFYDIKLPRSFEILHYLKSAKEIKKIVDKEKPILVHTHFSAATLTVRLSNIHKKYITLTTIHGLIFNTVKNPLKSFIFKQIELFSYGKCKKIWVLTESDKNAIKSSLKNATLYESKGLGCDLKKYNVLNYNETFKNNLKTKLNINQNDFVFIFVGRLTNFKGFDITVKAFNILQEKYNNIKLIVLGTKDAVHPTGLNYEEEKKYIENSSILKIGFAQNVNDYLSISHLTVFPSNKEGMPVNLMEAIAMQVPILTFNSRGCADIVEKNKYGWILNERTPECFAQKMEELYQNPNILQKVKQAQIENRDLFDRDHFIKSQIKSYQTLDEQYK